MTYVRIPLDLWEQLLAAVEREEEIVVTAPRPVVPAPPAPPVARNDNADVEAAFEDYGKFYDFLRTNHMLGPNISKDEFDGCNTILRHCIRARWPISWVAYALATAYHETAHTMLPVKERGGAAYFTRMYDIRGNRPAKARELGNLTPGDGAKYAGRGYPQTTGKSNYAKATKKLRAMGFDVDLVANPDLMLKPEIAAATMISGMEEGWFTSRKVTDDLPDDNRPATLAQFVGSRDVINGRDKDDEIAAYAIDYQTGLQYAGYRIP
jgi:putative chitinase